MEFRISEPTIQKLREVCRLRGVKRLCLFGSAAAGEYNPETSDLDFLVEFSTSDPDGAFIRYYGLKEDLEKLFSRPVDLLDLKTLTNPYIQSSVERSKVVLIDAA